MEREGRGGDAVDNAVIIYGTSHVQIGTRVGEVRLHTYKIT